MTALRVLHFGAGNIGRGFIGKLLAEAGCSVMFADVVQVLIEELKARKEYKVRVVADEGEKEDLVKVEGAVYSNQAEVLDEIVKAQLITTAVGPRILERLAPTLLKGFQMRREAGNEDPMNVIACENAIRATNTLREHVLKTTNDTDLIRWMDEHIGFADCAVDRIVPPSRHEDPLEVTVEDFCEWVVDERQMKGNWPRIPNVVYTDNLISFIERKLLTLNTGHAICAYLGRLAGHKEIRTSISDPQIRAVVEGAMRESGAVLIKRYNMDARLHEAYIQKIIRRFFNPHIVDDVVRVGREPIRKLGPEDRLIKPIRGCIEYGIPYPNLIKGVAAAMQYDDPEDAQAVKLQQLISELGVSGALKEVSGLVLEPNGESVFKSNLLNGNLTTKTSSAQV